MEHGFPHFWQIWIIGNFQLSIPEDVDMAKNEPL